MITYSYLSTTNEQRTTNFIAAASKLGMLNVYNPISGAIIVSDLALDSKTVDFLLHRHRYLLQGETEFTSTTTPNGIPLRFIGIVH